MFDLFYRARGLVELYWRGKTDAHVTCLSVEPEDITRFGTSIQITTRVVQNVKKVVNARNPPGRVNGPNDYLTRPLK